MYANPTKIRTHEVKVRLSDEENDLITALVNISGGQKAVLCREIILHGAAAIMECQEQPISKH